MKKSCLAVILMSLSSVAFGGAVTFQASEVNLGQGGGQGLYGALTNQWSAFNISGDGTSQVYNDSRDTFDQNGITNFSLTSLITFISPVNFLTVDYLILGGNNITLSVLDVNSNILATFVDSQLDNFNGSHFFNFSGIKKLSYSSSTTDLTGVSDLIWRTQGGGDVPEPTTALLMGIGVLGLALGKRLSVTKS